MQKRRADYVKLGIARSFKKSQVLILLDLNRKRDPQNFNSTIKKIRNTTKA
jgi:hypothetical protein